MPPLVARVLEDRGDPSVFPDCAGSKYSDYPWLTPIAPLVANCALGSLRQRSAERDEICRNCRRPLSDREMPDSVRCGTVVAGARSLSELLDRQIRPVVLCPDFINGAAVDFCNRAQLTLRTRIEFLRKPAQLHLRASECIAQVG
jgi:hypothetical protein